MFTKFKIYGALAFILILSVSIGYVIYDLKKTIKFQDERITKLEQEKTTLVTDLAIERVNVDKLLVSIDKQNHTIKVEADRVARLTSELEEWQKRPPEIKYVNKIVKEIITNTEYVSGDCEAGLELNRKISELKYEDL